jgi:hypothetical protein
VPLSYAVAIGYVLVDTVDKGVTAHARARAELEGGAVPVRADVDTGRLALLLAAERAVDTVVWQLLASVFVPGYTIHTVVAAVHAGLAPLEALPAVREGAAALAAALGGATTGDALLAVVDKSLPTVAGLAGAFFVLIFVCRVCVCVCVCVCAPMFWRSPKLEPPPAASLLLKTPEPGNRGTPELAAPTFSDLALSITTTPLTHKNTQPSPSSSTPSTTPSTPCSTSRCGRP